MKAKCLLLACLLPLAVVANPPFCLTGIVRYWATDQGVPGALVTLSGDASDSVLTDDCGHYSLAIPGAGNYQLTCAKTNDSPLANGVDSADTDAMRSNIVATIPFTSPYQFIAGDVNGSHTVSAADVTLVSRFINGTSNTFPVGLWQFVPFDYVFPATNSPWGFSNLVLTGVSGSIVGLDFHAVKVGDVNGSWTK